MEKFFRAARTDELEAVFLMGMDTWSEGRTKERYLSDCLRSPKYSRGTWYVLEEAQELRSSLIAYPLGHGTLGLGSIATPPRLRRRGYATQLIQSALNQFEDEGTSEFFLFSDIDPSFYVRFGFQALPPSFQPTPGSICMLKSPQFEKILNSADFAAPDYF